jgi:hypothetical protein
VNRTLLRNSTMPALRVLAGAALLTVLSGCDGQIIGPPTPPVPPIPPPPPRASWLSYKYSASCQDCPELRDQVEEQNYYCSIGVTGGSDPNGIDPANCAINQRPTLTLNTWKLANGFPMGATPGTHAIYGNLGDLRIGRDMNCVSANGNIACYVTNYGPLPFLGPPDNKENLAWVGVGHDFPALPGAITDAINHTTPFATVAMVYNQAAATSQSPNAVTFYVFGGDDNLFFSPGLDGEGFKTNPRMCMACHGGSYDTPSHSATGAQFLPFDVYYFLYSPGLELQDQQEGFRQLNKLVNDTHPEPAIADFIDKLYQGGVATPNTIVADDSYVPQGWSSEEGKKLYSSVYRPYCRMCHMASHTRPFLTFQDFKDLAPTIELKVCQSTDMPNAEVPYITFWQNKLAQEDLRNFLIGEGLTNLHSCQ